eukprot:GHRQ01025526.1.p4 GENE.GHRQ01025526.1~~GHRQ01025526.1.p4  ORF type:complete len:109 (+),score=21.80 GHRQ01025526.1:518-844(+)
MLAESFDDITSCRRIISSPAQADTTPPAVCNTLLTPCHGRRREEGVISGADMHWLRLTTCLLLQHALTCISTSPGPHCAAALSAASAALRATTYLQDTMTRTKPIISC